MEATVIPGTIERDIVIEAPVEAIWRAVTARPDQPLVYRLSPDRPAPKRYRHAGMGRPGDKPASHRAPAHRDHRAAAHVLVPLAPPRRCRSRRQQLPARRVHAHPEGRHTRLRLAESGLSQIDWPKEQKAAYATQNSKGWDIHLAHLRDYAEGQQEGQ
jgi:hypothetical protein